MIPAIKENKRQDKQQTQLKHGLFTTKTQILSIFFFKKNEKVKIPLDKVN